MELELSYILITVGGDHTTKWNRKMAKARIVKASNGKWAVIIEGEVVCYRRTRSAAQEYIWGLIIINSKNNA